MSKPKTKQPSMSDVVRLGSDLASVKASTDPKAWKKIVNTAHKGGWTVSGLLSGDAPALRERTQASLKSQAQKTITSAFAPAEQENNTQLSRVAAWDDKRKKDNAAFEAWLADQRTAADTRMTGAMQALKGVTDSATSNVAQEWAAAPGAAQAAVQGQGGVVSNLGDSNALKMIGAAGQAANAQTQATADQATATGQSVIDTQKILDAAGTGLASARDAQRTADTGKARQDILDKQSDLAIKKASSVLDEWSRLQNQQVSIAQGKADNAIVADKLNVTKNTLAETIRHNQADETNAATANKTRAADVRLKRNAKDYNLDGVVNAADRADKVADQIKVKKASSKATKAGTPKAATGAQQTHSETKWEQAVNVMHQLQDWHAGTQPPKNASFRQVLRRRGASDLLIDIGEDLRKHNGKLSAAGRAKARQLGILHPEKLSA